MLAAIVCKGTRGSTCITCMCYSPACPLTAASLLTQVVEQSHGILQHIQLQQ